MVGVGGWGGLNETPGIPYSKILCYTKLDFPTKFNQNRAKIDKVSHLSCFWVGELGGLNMDHIPIGSF